MTGLHCRQAVKRFAIDSKTVYLLAIFTCFGNMREMYPQPVVPVNLQEQEVEQRFPQA